MATAALSYNVPKTFTIQSPAAFRKYRIFITGNNPGPLQFGGTSHITMTAPIDGPMAGLLVYEDRALPQKLTHKITSADARKLIGTIYLPVGDLLIDSGQTVADQSAYTAIIVNHLLLKSGPNLGNL